MANRVTDPALLSALEGVQPVDASTAAALEAAHNADRAAAARQWMDQQNARAARESFDSLSPAQKFIAGVGKPVQQLVSGVKHLVSDPTADDQNAAIYRQQMHGPAETAGEIAGNAAALALPAGGAAGTAARLGSLLPRALARLAPVGVDAGVNAGVEALKDPDAGGSRATNAVTGAAGSMLGSAGGSVLRATMLGLRPASDAAARMLKQGIPLTPGMMKGGVVQAIEEKLAGVPIVGNAIRARQRDAIESWNQNMLNSLVPEGEVTAAGHEGFQQAKGAFRSAYEKLWANDIPADSSAIADSWEGIAKQMRPGTVASDVSQTLAGLRDKFLASADGSGVLPGSTVSQMDDMLRMLSTRANRQGETEAAQAFQQARGAVRSALPAEVNGELSRIDGLYKQYSVTRRAASYTASAAADGAFTPQQLLRASLASDKSAGKDAVARGVATLQPEATQAAGVMGDVRPAGKLEQTLGAGALGAAVYTNPKLLGAAAAGGAAYTRPVNSWLTGQTGFQEYINNALGAPNADALIQALRNYVRPAQIGTSIADTEDK